MRKRRAYMPNGRASDAQRLIVNVGEWLERTNRRRIEKGKEEESYYMCA